MTAYDLLNFTTPELIKTIKANIGLNQFAIERAKFEGWLKVELINILKGKGKDAVPEKNKIDVTFNKTAIELKTVNTNYACVPAVKKHKTITKNINGIITDIHKLNLDKNHTEKFVFFIVFPLPKVKEKLWEKHIPDIETRAAEIESVDFCFNNGIPGKIYCCKIYPKKKIKKNKIIL